jgi:alpha-L-fucosidase 2
VLGAACLPAAAMGVERYRTLDGFAIATRHKIVRTVPTPDFFEGMLLGNGDIGVCVTVRPDALGLHIGKSDAWDIRVSEDHARHVLPFAEVLKLWERASEESKKQGKPEATYLEDSDPALREYAEKASSSYRKSWPRPWPCGIVWLHWDVPQFRVVRQELDPSSGLFSLELARGGEAVHLYCFVNTAAGHVCLWSDEAAAFRSVAYYPNVDAQAQLPEPQTSVARVGGSAEFTCVQRFPATSPTAETPAPRPSPADRSFALRGALKGDWVREGTAGASFRSARSQALRLDIALYTPRDHADPAAEAARVVRGMAGRPAREIQRESEAFWREYWSRSAVLLADKKLEEHWYHNLYWLGCCLREGKVAPGLFGNWTSGKIGTAWHGDYHMNYNTQQVFWGVFSSNHADQHLPYIEIVEKLLPMAESTAREQFGLPGAYFPHSAYPAPSQAVPYPAPPWAYEICETPWTVQSLWWHYLYTQDDAVLGRIYRPLKEAAQFITAYAKRGEDGKFHLNPTVSPENWGFTVDQRLNQDGIMDLALARFLLSAVVEASEKLGVDADERRRWTEVGAGLAPYPKVEGPDGEVWVDVRNAPAGWIYNVPVTLAPVFPGEQVGLGGDPRDLEIARRTAATVRLEGGNDIVYQPLIRARLGMLDLAWFKDEVKYCQVPNGIVQDRVRQTGGRYAESTNFDFMMRMGVWTENLSLPAVLNECMLQSYSGILRVFPNTTNLGPARFQNLRARGAFLVSATWDGKQVSPVEIRSEKGGVARMANPWHPDRVAVTVPSGNPATVEASGGVVSIETKAGVVYRVARA